MNDRYKHSDITGQIIRAFYKVYNTLGYGFLERVYGNSLAIELRQQGLSVIQQAPIKVYYNGQLVGEYYADLLVEDRVIVELKTVEALADEHYAQLLNYLKATKIQVGLLLNFGPTEPEVRRRIFETARKRLLPDGEY
jgi:GxxExxY protein